MALVAAGAAQIGQEAENPLLRRVGLHQRVEDPDLAGRAVVHHRPVEHCDDRIGLGKPLPVLREDRRSRRIAVGERIFVRDEDVDALGPQPRRALVDEGPLVRGEERPGKVDPHRATLTPKDQGGDPKAAAC